MKIFIVKLFSYMVAASFVHAISEQAKDVRGNLAGDSVIEVQLGSKAYQVLQELGADKLGHTENFDGLHFRVSGDHLRVLAGKGHDFQNYTEEFLGKMQRRLNNEDPNFRWCLFGAECAMKPAEEFYAEYQPLESIWERAKLLVNRNKRLARISSIGTSYEGRDLKTIEISSTPSWVREKKPLVFYFCNIHAREWLTPMYCIHMAEELLKGRNGHDLLDTYDFTILLSANPDGYTYTWTNDTMWRKTRKPNNGSDCVGTDPNRNYPMNFGGAGSSSDPCSNSFRGIEPLDQFETKAITDYVLANEHRIITMMDVHTYGTMWMSPYGGYFDPPPQEDYDQMMKCSEAGVDAIEGVNGNRWFYGSVSGTIYVASGVSVDWAYYNAGVLYSYTVELRGVEFQPNSTNIVPSNAEMFAGMVASLKCIAQEELGAPIDEPDVPTPPPTSYPTHSCVDSVPSYVVWDDDTPAPCNELGPWCEELDFVRNNCPVTCDKCSPESDSSANVSSEIFVLNNNQK